MKSPEYQEAGRAASMMMDYEKILRMNSLMKRVNRLKSPSKEFFKMSEAMFKLNEYAEAMYDKRNRKEDFSNDDFNGYEECLNALNEATKAYIHGKRIEPKTEKGRERRDAAISIENRVEDLIRGFDAEKKRDNEEIATEK